MVSRNCQWCFFFQFSFSVLSHEKIKTIAEIVSTLMAYFEKLKKYIYKYKYILREDIFLLFTACKGWKLP